MENKLELYWSEIPVGKNNAASYPDLMLKWDRKERDVRAILHELSAFDNGDDYILIRSAKKGGGFYRTDNPDDIKAYREECLAKGRSTFAPVKKINRVLKNNAEQFSVINNLRVMRQGWNKRKFATRWNSLTARSTFRFCRRWKTESVCRRCCNAGNLRKSTDAQRAIW